MVGPKTLKSNEWMNAGWMSFAILQKPLKGDIGAEELLNASLEVADDWQMFGQYRGLLQNVFWMVTSSNCVSDLLCWVCMQAHNELKRSSDLDLHQLSMQQHGGCFAWPSMPE